MISVPVFTGSLIDTPPRPMIDPRSVAESTLAATFCDGSSVSVCARFGVTVMFTNGDRPVRMLFVKVTLSVASVAPKTRVLPTGTKPFMPQTSGRPALRVTVRGAPTAAKPPDPVHST